MQDDEYELMPRTELEYLRKEVEKLKRNPLGDTQASISLLESINKLNANIVRMNEILSSANDDMVKMFNDTNMQSQLTKVADQQEKLAKGIVAVAELVKKLESERAAPLPSLDTMIPKPAQPAPVSSQPSIPLPPVQPMQSSNPFETPGRQQFNPIINEPLPRPSGQPVQSQDLRDLPLPPPIGSVSIPPLGNPGMPPMQQSMPPGNGPNPFIPDADIPPPPPRRR